MSGHEAVRQAYHLYYRRLVAAVYGLTVAMNLARSRWRRRRLFDTLVRAGRVERTPESVPGISPDRVALVAALQRLPRATREALVLHHLADLPVAEVAAVTGASVGTVKSRLSRGRTALAELLDHRKGPARARPSGGAAPAPSSKETRHA